MITIISGTNRPESNSLKVANFYQEALRFEGVETIIFNLENLPKTMIASDLYGNHSPEFEKIQKLIKETAKFLFIIPEYNGSFPGVLKTFIDACSYPDSFYDKKAALVGISSGKYGNIRGIDHFGSVCSYLHLQVLPLRLHISSINTELNDQGKFIKEDTLKFIRQQITRFISF